MITAEDLTAARVLADSINPHGHRLTTLEVTFPRFILAEFNTHRVFSRNSASSRAIPMRRQIETVEQHPFVPARFPVNEPGMSAKAYWMPGDSEFDALVQVWLRARDHALATAREFAEHGVHKQIGNRVLEPFMWHTAIVSSTTWSNFFELRISTFAQPEIRRTAELMRDALDASTPALVATGGWHLPLVFPGDRDTVSALDLPKISAARCAAVSYNRHTECDATKELARYELLSTNGHLSPLEHPARSAGSAHVRCANYTGWQQARFFVEQGCEWT